jgi:hypothetical protein
MTGHETTNERDETMNGFKIMGMAEEGKCEHCGANCPKRRVYVMPVDADGNHDGEVQCWGVICASKVRGEKGKASEVSLLAKFAGWVDHLRAMADAGRDFDAIWRASPFPTRLKGRTVEVYYPGSREWRAAASFEMPAA